MKKQHNRYAKKPDGTPSANPVMGQAWDSIEQVNKYGTYNIQPTNDSDNIYPEIAQGLPRTHRKPRIKRPIEQQSLYKAHLRLFALTLAISYKKQGDVNTALF